MSNKLGGMTINLCIVKPLIIQFSSPNYGNVAANFSEVARRSVHG